jgi:hypothetical protein
MDLDFTVSRVVKTEKAGHPFPEWRVYLESMDGEKLMLPMTHEAEALVYRPGLTEIHVVFTNPQKTLDAAKETT